VSIANIQMNTKKQLIEYLEKNTKVLQTPRIKSAFEKIDRKDFVPDDYKQKAYEDYPLPIGFGQTISQPTTVAFMFELLDLKPNHKVLDVGSGSGYTTALLAFLVPNGEILGLEILPELAEMGKNNLRKYDFTNAKIERGNGQSIFTDSPQKFDRILVNATTEKVPENLIGVLKSGGKMVIPIKQSILKITKKDDKDIYSVEYPGFVFVPLR